MNHTHEIQQQLFEGHLWIICFLSRLTIQRLPLGKTKILLEIQREKQNQNKIQGTKTEVTNMTT